MISPVKSKQTFLQTDELLICSQTDSTCGERLIWQHYRPILTSSSLSNGAGEVLNGLNTSRKFCSATFQTWDEGLCYRNREAAKSQPRTPLLDQYPNSSFGVTGQGLHLPQSFSAKFLWEKKQPYLHPEPPPSGSKHNICNHRKSSVLTVAKHYRIDWFF